MKRFKFLGLTALILVAACTVMVKVSHGDSSVKVGVTIGAVPAGMQPIGKIKVDVPGLGVIETDGFDTDGNGTVDTGGPVNGEYWKLDTPTSKKLLAGGGGPHTFTGQTERKELVYQVYYNPIVEPAIPLSPTFAHSAMWYLNEFGLGDVTNPAGLTAPNALQIQGTWTSDEDPENLPSQLGLDVVLNWNTELGWVDNEEFPSLMFEDFGVPEYPGTFPHYAVRHVAGDAGAVCNWLAENGIESFGVKDVYMFIPDIGSQFFNEIKVAINQDAGVAIFAADGTIITIPLIN